MSAGEAIHDFLNAMALEGIKPVDPISHRLASGELIRFRCEGDGKGRLNGWAILYLDARPAGAFGNYRMGIERKWKLGDDYAPLTREERDALQREWAEAKTRRQEEQHRSEQEAAVEAVEMWKAAQPASAVHGYVVRKRLDPSPLKQIGEKLLIPMLDATGKLWNLQRIAPDGTKRFLRGGRTAGLFCLIAYDSRDPATFCIGEGYATMAAVHRNTGHPCIVAFSAKNLQPVAKLWNEARPDIDFIICADDDAHLDNNLGLNAARAAALAIGARLAVPRVSEAA